MKTFKYYGAIFMFLLIATYFTFTNEVMALSKEKYFENDNGVIFSKNEYDFISKIYWDGYQSLMTQEEYIEFKMLGVMDEQVKTKTLDYPKIEILPLGTSITQASRTLKISKACTTSCVLTVTLTWIQNPTVRSYDVMGAYLDGTTLIGTPSTTIVVGNNRSVVSDLTKTAKGIGSSFKLPSGSNLKITQTFRVNKGGHVYASYQHAMQTSTLAISKDYTFSKLGYGSVFDFSQNSKRYYDGMNGVDIEV